jgi:hypothetical protein
MKEKKHTESEKHTGYKTAYITAAFLDLACNFRANMTEYNRFHSILVLICHINPICTKIAWHFSLPEI